MKKYRILSAFLTLVMLISAMTTGVSAAWADKVDEDGDPIINYMTKAYSSPGEKLADMIKVKEENGFQLWYEEFTGEVAVLNVATGQVLFSNPYDVASRSATSNSVKSELLSQIMIEFLQSGQKKTFNSYTEAALRGQIYMKNIKGGIRVEYTIGEPQTIRLVPRMIEKSRFEQLIYANIDNEWLRDKLYAFYTIKDPFDPKNSERAILEMQTKYPCTMEMAIYVCSPDINARELRDLENTIKTYCPAYSYEELEADHEATGYTGNDVAPPRFRMALEYTLEEDGLSVRLPANSIEFDESVYQLQQVKVLPYFGAGNNAFEGYTMIMDGSGTLIRFEDVMDRTYNVSAQVYGADYAYHEINGQHSETMRWPIWGIMTDYTPNAEKLAKDAEAKEKAKAEAEAKGEEYVEKEIEVVEDAAPLTYTNGFVAIITEGDSLATIMSEHGGGLHPYNTVYPIFIPRPSDTYNLADSISVSGSASWTVTSERKYTGSYRIRYIMLTDPAIAEEKNLKDTFDTDWVGMALATRDYLTDKGVLSKLESVKDDIPLYIETFGAMKTLERVASFPVEVDTPLTTFEDIKAMHAELTEMGVGNIAFKLNGYANGTISNTTYPAKLSWTKVVGGADGFVDLVNYANENGFSVYPDFDFAYMTASDVFDGVSLKKDAIKTIDNRYTRRRAYNPATQSFDKTFALCISPKSFGGFYDKFGPEYLQYGNVNISVATMGTDLSSDFDEDEPYHREDNKGFTTEFLERLDNDYESVMIAGGNMYALKYADVITGMSLESSQYVRASESIPFTGMVLHGSKVITGTATNMEGDINEAILRSIESGAYLYFTLAYQNTNRMKEDEQLSGYYSVNYEIWKEDVARYYTTLNSALHDQQDAYIVDHEFIEAYRVPDADEKEADEAVIAAAAAANEAAKKEAEEKQARQERLNQRLIAEGLLDPKDATNVKIKPKEIKVDEEALKQKYLTDSGSVIRVEYETGVNFVLNYNSFSVTVTFEGDTYELAPMSFVRID